MQGIKFIGNLPPEGLKNKKILLRVDFNVPITSSGLITNNFRIERAMKTLNYLRNCGAKVVVISHIGRKESDTLRPVFNYVKRLFEISFFEDVYGSDLKSKLEDMKEGEVVLLENLRKWEGEKENSQDFAKHLSGFAEIFVNDAFSSSHREHASIVGIPKYLNSYMGFSFKEEVENLSKLFSPEEPLFIIISGAKFETKMPFIEALRDKADKIFIGGALANDVFRQEGYDISGSKTSGFDTTNIIQMIKEDKVVVPIDVIVIDKFGFKKTKYPKKLAKGDKVVDAGPKTANKIKSIVKQSNTIVWNGPLGLYEQGYSFLTQRVAKAIASSEAFTIVGGGDTVAEIADMNLMQEFDFISMAGGAMLDFIAEGTLVGIEVLKG